MDEAVWAVIYMNNVLVNLDTLSRHDLPMVTTRKVVAQELRWQRKELSYVLSDLISSGQSTSLDYYKYKDIVDSINTLLTKLYPDVPMDQNEQEVLQFKRGA